MRVDGLRGFRGASLQNFRLDIEDIYIEYSNGLSFSGPCLSGTRCTRGKSCRPTKFKTVKRYKGKSQRAR